MRKLLNPITKVWMHLRFILYFWLNISMNMINMGFLWSWKSYGILKCVFQAWKRLGNSSSFILSFSLRAQAWWPWSCPTWRREALRSTPGSKRDSGSASNGRRDGKHNWCPAASGTHTHTHIFHAKQQRQHFDYICFWLNYIYQYEFNPYLLCVLCPSCFVDFDIWLSRVLKQLCMM